MAFPSTGILDAFNRANENPLANGTWAQMGATLNYYRRGQILSNVLGAITGSPTASYWTPTTFAADQEVYGTIATKPVNGEYVFLWTRIQNPVIDNLDGYLLMFRTTASTDEWLLTRVDDDTFTQLGATITQELTAGQGFGLEIVGTTLTAYYFNGTSWVSLGTRTDAAYGGTSSLGVGGFDNAIWRLDNFGGGAVAVEPPPIPVYVFPQWIKV